MSSSSSNQFKQFPGKCDHFVAMTMSLLGLVPFPAAKIERDHPPSLDQLVNVVLDRLVTKGSQRDVSRIVWEVVDSYKKLLYPVMLEKLDQLKKSVSDLINLKIQTPTTSSITRPEDIAYLTRVRIWAIISLYDTFAIPTSDEGNQTKCREKCQQAFHDMIRYHDFQQALTQAEDKKKSLFRFIETHHSIADRMRILKELSAVRLVANFWLTSERDVLWIPTHSNPELTELVPTPMKLLTGYKYPISSLTIYQEKTLITASHDGGKVCIFDLETMTMNKTVITEHDSITKIAIHGDIGGSGLPLAFYTMGGRDDIRAWEIDFLHGNSPIKQQRIFRPIRSGYYYLHWAFDREKMFTLCRSGVIQVWDLLLGSVIASIKAGGSLSTAPTTSSTEKPVFTNFLLHPQGHRLFATHIDGLIRVWDISNDSKETGTGKYCPREIGRSMKSFSPGDLNNEDTKLCLVRTLAATATAGAIIETNHWLFSFNGTNELPIFQADKRVLNESAVVLRIHTEIPLNDIGSVTCFALTDNQSLLFTGHNHGHVMIWDCTQSTPRLVRTIICFPNRHHVHQIAIAGKYLCVSGGENMTDVKLWNWQTNECLMSFVMADCVFTLLIQNGLLYVGGSSEIRVFVL